MYDGKALGPWLPLAQWLFGNNEQWQFLRDWDVLGNSLARWFGAGLLVILGFFLLRLIAALLANRLRALADRRKIDWLMVAADLFRHVKPWFLLVIALSAGSIIVTLPDRIVSILHVVTMVALVIQAAFWGNTLLDFAVSRYAQRRLETDAAAVTTISAIGYLCRIALWVVVGLVILDTMGVEVTAMVAGLGIGGIAVALAAQNILGDLFASLSIVLDKPFVLGDFIIVGDKLGTVEHIGLKTTRLRSLSGEQLIFSNNDLLNSRIHNYKRMMQRRALFTVGVTYQTPAEKLAMIPSMIQRLIESEQDTRFDRAHFKEFGPYALNFEVVYFVLAADIRVYLDIQQRINLELCRQFEREGIEFAYPTQTVYVMGEGREARDEGPEGQRH